MVHPISASSTSASLIPKTGKVTEYAVPELKPGYPGWPARYRGRQSRGFLGRHDVSRSAREGSIRRPRNSTSIICSPSTTTTWHNSNMLGTAIRRGRQGFGRIAPDTGDLYPARYQDWNLREIRADEASSDKGPRPRFYGIDSDSHNNLYFCGFYEQLHRPASMPRTGGVFVVPDAHCPFTPAPAWRMDPQDPPSILANTRATRLECWTRKLRNSRNGPLPTPWTGPYYVTLGQER